MWDAKRSPSPSRKENADSGRKAISRRKSWSGPKTTATPASASDSHERQKDFWSRAGLVELFYWRTDGCCSWKLNRQRGPFAKNRDSLPCSFYNWGMSGIRWENFQGLWKLWKNEFSGHQTIRQIGAGKERTPEASWGRKAFSNTGNQSQVLRVWRRLSWWKTRLRDHGLPTSTV